MKKIGITGQSGFIGYHLYQYLRLQKKQVQLIDFKDQYFEDEGQLSRFVGSCDVIVHLAGMNRHGDPQVIYDTNIRLAHQLTNAADRVGAKPHILFSSSTQEERDNPYGKSKREARLWLANWAAQKGVKFTGFVIPNVFGPFGNPFYNSVIATFSHQIASGQNPKIDIDAEMKLIYVNNLVEIIYQNCISEDSKSEVFVNHMASYKVTEVLSKLVDFKETYMDKGVIPELPEYFDVCLFNTFRCYMNPAHYPFYLKNNQDNRGSLFEAIKTNTKGQMFFSTTHPGIIRGNHFHRRKIERFCVVKGEAVIRLRRVGTSEIIEYPVSGDKPSFIDMPVYHTHNITNTGNSELLTIFWANEFFNTNDPDTYFEEV
ncbi:MAG: epimerase [Bacteroidetes bacterium RIFOXYA12_FULL_35_11]|nr:MAG: epimerase [Bacteroidetes bacterium GWF2_35_48]OFY73234.1 MAG: epimerase [Bacteroidetes bacterium RIFOXYA12_FULL_35_11]OFY94619.1 MAG: epimerase [Bacteroidetes bacterium RIFOXYC12_FULL_35_7]HBX53520.1 epimerase [Bacteroidales bacterium]